MSEIDEMIIESISKRAADIGSLTSHAIRAFKKVHTDIASDYSKLAKPLSQAMKDFFSRDIKALPKIRRIINDGFKAHMDLLKKPNKTDDEKAEAFRLIAQIFKEAVEGTAFVAIFAAPIPFSGVFACMILHVIIQHLSFGTISLIPKGIRNTVLLYSKEAPTALPESLTECS